MNGNQIFVAILLALFTATLGGIAGYSMGVINMQEEAIAAGVAVWQPYETDKINQRDGKRVESFEFRWLK